MKWKQIAKIQNIVFAVAILFFRFMNIISSNSMHAMVIMIIYHTSLPQFRDYEIDTTKHGPLNVYNRSSWLLTTVFIVIIYALGRDGRI